MTIRLLIADDHAVVRQGLRLFMELDQGIEVLSEEASTGLEAVELARRTHPDVILMDLLMPGMDGITATEIIHHEVPGTQVIALTSVLEDSDDSSVVGAVRAGAVGYLLKTTDADELRRGVHAAAAGQVQLSPAAAKRLVREVTAPSAEAPLTPRERQVLVLLARGKANKEIARDLRIGQQTVKTYVSNILSKLGVHSRTQAALHAAEAGLIGHKELAQV
jgi:two-component system, NarL family, response regulator LiaR